MNTDDERRIDDEYEYEYTFEEEHMWDGLDEGFSSWDDYYRYKYGQYVT